MRFSSNSIDFLPFLTFKSHKFPLNSLFLSIQTSFKWVNSYLLPLQHSISLICIPNSFFWRHKVQNHLKKYWKVPWKHKKIPPSCLFYPLNLRKKSKFRLKTGKLSKIKGISRRYSEVQNGNLCQPQDFSGFCRTNIHKNRENRRKFARNKKNKANLCVFSVNLKFDNFCDAFIDTKTRFCCDFLQFALIFVYFGYNFPIIFIRNPAFPLYAARYTYIWTPSRLQRSPVSVPCCRSEF